MVFNILVKAASLNKFCSPESSLLLLVFLHPVPCMFLKKRPWKYVRSV